MNKQNPKPEAEQIDQLMKQVWGVFDQVRGLILSSDDYDLVLYLLLLHHNGQLDNILNDNDFLKGFDLDFKKDNNLVSFTSECKIEPFQMVKAIYKPIHDRLRSEDLSKLKACVKGINQALLQQHFPIVFDKVLSQIFKIKRKSYHEYVQPAEITRFILRLAGIKSDARVFNPFAGLASFGAYLDKGQRYYGQEINQRMWAIGVMRLIAYNHNDVSSFLCDDSILHWPAENEKFDLVISFPPFMMKLQHQKKETEENLATAEQFLIQKGIQSLNAKGKLVAILREGFLYSTGPDKEVRKELVSRDLIDTIVSLPGGLLTGTSIPVTILFLSNSKDAPGKVKFINAGKFVRINGNKDRVLDADGLIDFIHSGVENLDLLRIVDTQQIIDNDFNLSVPRYFKRQIEGRKLGEIIEFIRGHRSNLPPTGKLIRIRDLKDDKVDFRLDVATVEEGELRGSDIYQITESCLLLAVRWKTLKPTYFEYKGEAIYRSKDILSFKVSESLVDTAYLISELHADYVQEQLDALRTGATTPFISRSDLLDVIINLPSPQEQRAKVQGLRELSAKISTLKAERDALAHGVGSKLYESASTIKHSLGKPLLNIGSSLRNIENALTKFNANWRLYKLNERYDITIKDSFDSVYSNLELIHSLLRNNESVLDLNKYELKELEFMSFIKGYVKMVKAAEKINVSTNIDIHPDIKIQQKNKISVQANPELLEIALNAIVENANMHAFVDNSKQYKLEFRVSLYVVSGLNKKSDDTSDRFDTCIKIEVANNGKPFPQNYSLEKLIRKNSFAGETGNTGQGGFDLNEIIKYHNNGMSTLELITDDITNEFTTTYSFLIPIIK